MAADGFPGFSEEDLRKINVENSRNEHEKNEKYLEKKSRGATGKKSNKVKKQMSYKSLERINGAETSISKDQMLLPTELHVNDGVGLSKHDEQVSKDSSTCAPSNHMNGLPVVKLRVKSDGHSVEVVNGVESRLKALSDRNLQEVAGYNEESHDHFHQIPLSPENGITTPNIKMSLEEFQWRQKMIEEQNSKRRALLTKALADRRKKTIAETEKLSYIQKELEKLNSLVSNDIAILRKHIETASFEFSEVQKRYEKAEKEFVDAKLELFKKMERKEQLTEHLCTIIEQNELRKAKKLADLMYELELDNLIEETAGFEFDEPVLSQLCLMNNICTKVPDVTECTPKELCTMTPIEDGEPPASL